MKSDRTLVLLVGIFFAWIAIFFLFQALYWSLRSSLSGGTNYTYFIAANGGIYMVGFVFCMLISIICIESAIIDKWGKWSNNK